MQNAVAWAGGKAWITEYAFWQEHPDEGFLDGNYYARPQHFTSQDDPVGYLKAIKGGTIDNTVVQGFAHELLADMQQFTPQTRALLRRLFPRPANMADIAEEKLDACRWCPYCEGATCKAFWPAVAAAKPDVDKWLAAITEALVPTTNDFRAARECVEKSLEGHRAALSKLGVAPEDPAKLGAAIPGWTLTRLYTVVAPGQMDDVVFAFNPHMPRVDNLLQRDATLHCEDPDEVWISLPCKQQPVTLAVAMTQAQCAADHPVAGLATGGVGVLPNCGPPDHKYEIADEFGLPVAVAVEDLPRVNGWLREAKPGVPTADAKRRQQLKPMPQADAEPWQRWPDVQQPEPSDPSGSAKPDPQGTSSCSAGQRSGEPSRPIGAVAFALLVLMAWRRRRPVPR